MVEDLLESSSSEEEGVVVGDQGRPAKLDGGEQTVGAVRRWEAVAGWRRLGLGHRDSTEPADLF